MLFNHPRALAWMDKSGLDALVAAVPRNVYYASGYWTRISEWGFQENHAAVIIPRDESKPATLIVRERAISAVVEHPAANPAFGRLKSFELEPDTVLNFEVLYFGHTLAPYHIESTYLIKQDGAECLHTIPKALRVV